MKYLNKKESTILFLGDLFILLDSLWITLLIRNLEIPKDLVGSQLFWAFSILSIFWTFSFYVAGLYKKHTLILKNNLVNILFNTQIINIIIAVLFFYLIPYFSVAPKTILFIYLVVSSVLVYLWRVFIFPLIRPVKKQNAILIAKGEEMKELIHEVNNNPRYSFNIVNYIDVESEINPELEKTLLKKIEENNVRTVIADLGNEKVGVLLPKLYELIFRKIEFIDFCEVYESIFDRIPVSSLDHSWFIKHIDVKSKLGYDFFKRVFDTLIASILFIPSLIFYPFAILGMYLETKTNPFIVQERIGKDNKKVHIFKFRSMTSNDKGKWPSQEDNRITKFGKILRASRIDELPQLINVIKGDISLIGPRPDITGLFTELDEKISYYKVRNVVKPGLSGWAQTHQEIPPHSIEETKIRLSYDLYYIKYRSFILDFKIALQTLKTLISRTGK
jgi:lipopolysaccharide/colanic/teichoic acid biosynthesis glycosyltransferase